MEALLPTIFLCQLRAFFFSFAASIYIIAVFKESSEPDWRGRANAIASLPGFHIQVYAAEHQGQLWL